MLNQLSPGLTTSVGDPQVPAGHASAALDQNFPCRYLQVPTGYPLPEHVQYYLPLPYGRQNVHGSILKVSDPDSLPSS